MITASSPSLRFYYNFNNPLISKNKALFTITKHVDEDDSAKCGLINSMSKANGHLFLFLFQHHDVFHMLGVGEHIDGLDFRHAVFYV